MLSLWLVTAVQAGPWRPAAVLYAGDPATAVDRASEDSGTPTERLDPVRWSTLFDGDTLWVEGASFPAEACEPVDLATLRAQLEAAEGWFFSMVLDRAHQDLDGVLGGLCGLTETLDPALAARAAYLSGVMAALEEQEPAAVAAFQRARDFDPDLAWDTSLQDDPLPAFQQTRAPTPPARLVLDEHLDPRNVRVDGHPLLPVTGPHVISEGVHLLQVVAPSVRSLRITVESGAEVRVIDPVALPPELAEHPEDPSAQSLTARAVLRAEDLLQPRVLWVGEAGTWELDRALMAWEQRRRRPNWIAVGGGVGLAAAGASVAAWSLWRGQALVDGYEPGRTTAPRYASLQADLERQRWIYRGGWLAGGLGLALSGTALVMPRLEARLLPGPAPLGGTLVLRRRP